MSAIRQAPFGRSQRISGATPRVLALVLVCAAALLVLLWWVQRRSVTRRAIAAMSPDERRALFDATHRQMELECSPSAPRGLRSSCTDAAEKITLFPECDRACSEEARGFLPSAAR